MRGWEAYTPIVNRRYPTVWGYVNWWVRWRKHIVYRDRRRPRRHNGLRCGCGYMRGSSDWRWYWEIVVQRLGIVSRGEVSFRLLRR